MTLRAAAISAALLLLSSGPSTAPTSPPVRPGRYTITLSGSTTTGPFRLDGVLQIVSCSRHPADIVIATRGRTANRGTLRFASSHRAAGAMASELSDDATLETCTISATEGELLIAIDPQRALRNPSNVMSTSNGRLAIGRQIISGTIRLHFTADGAVAGEIALSDNPYSPTATYRATLNGSRVAS